MFVHLLVTIYNNSMKQVTIHQRFTRAEVVHKSKHVGDRISKFHSLTMLNPDLKILVKILKNHLQIVLPRLICPEHTCVMKSRIIQDSLHMVCTIIEKAEGNAALINFHQSKAFDRIDYGFLEAALSAAGFGLYFWS